MTCCVEGGAMAAPNLTSLNSSGNRRQSIHVEPTGAYDTIQHYIRDLVYGATDGIVTTFAAVSGVAGGSLSVGVVAVVGLANLFADGLSMGVGNYLSIRAHEGARELQQLPEEEARPARHGLATFLAFVVAGAVPLAAYVVPSDADVRFPLAASCGLASLFSVGAARACVSAERWWKSGLEMFLLGALVAGVAYATGALVATIVADLV